MSEDIVTRFCKNDLLFRLSITGYMRSGFFLVSMLLLLVSCHTKIESERPTIVPFPQIVDLHESYLDLSGGYTWAVANEGLEPLRDIFGSTYYLLSGQRVEDTSTGPELRIELRDWPEEKFEILIDDLILIKAGSYPTAVHATTTIFQMMTADTKIAKGIIKDEPAKDFRSVMIDCARQFHPIDNLKQIVELARWYKIRYLHLHLTDDQLFTFPSIAFPALPSEGQHYTLDELRELNQYAYDRGVIIIPEIDVPGHASQFISKMPELFGIQDLEENSYTIHMGRPAVYEALKVLYQEVADVFTYSPYIHVGGDEAHFAGFEADSETREYMNQNGLSTIKELFVHFLIEMDEIVKSTGKQTILWAGFPPNEKIKIPKDVIIMLWESEYYDPQTCVEDGYTIINASFKPLYVVNNRKWAAQYIYEIWTPYRWEGGTNFSSSFEGIEITPTDQVIGVGMSSWEQSPEVEVLRLRRRLAAMSEKVNQSSIIDYVDFASRLEIADKKLEKVLRPFTLDVDGLILSPGSEGNFYEHLKYDDTLSIDIANTLDANVIIKFSYTDEVTFDSEPFDRSIHLLPGVENAGGTTVTLQAFDQLENRIGHPYTRTYYYQPVLAMREGIEVDRMASSWEKLRFKDSLKITLSSNFTDGNIRYEYTNSKGERTSGHYAAPLTFTATTHLKAWQETGDGEQVGGPLRESYYVVREANCLTTGKEIIASNEATHPGTARKAVNGRVTLWEHWGDHNTGDNWLMVDLEKVESITRFETTFFWDGYRYYNYTIDISVDGDQWTRAVDRSDHREVVTIYGYTDEVDALEARYLRLNILENSANPGLHVTEFCAW